MFKAIKYIANLVRENCEYRRGVADLILKLHKPDSLIVESDIKEVGYVFAEIIKLQKENAELRARLNNIEIIPRIKR